MGEAFRVYAGIFAQANPKRASELFQHMANIREAANIFSWESVYAYDKQFREIMDFFLKEIGVSYITMGG